MSAHDLVIIGAGPAGATAAITAARAGASVMLLDKATFPRDKCCGDGLTALALRELDHLGLDPARLPTWQAIDSVAVRSPDGRHANLALPSGSGLHAAVVRRAELDAELVSMAVEAGAQLVEGAVFSSLSDPAGDTLTVTCADGTAHEARHVIAADGMWSPVRRHLGLTPDGYRGEWHAFRQYFTATGEQSRRLWVWFEPDLLPGYAWSFPLADGRINVGFGVVRNGGLDGGELKRIWAGLLNRPHVREVVGDVVPEGVHKAWPIPANMPSATLAHGRVLFVGDAATVTDPMTGEGIGQAIETGRLAAQACLIAGGATAGEMYEQSARKSLQLDHRFADLLGKMLSRTRLTTAALRAVNVNDWTRRNFARWMFEDYPRAALFTPRRWSALRSNSGAFVDR
ncbi:MAG: geranylgeranyl reductase family protein [Candidatus Poriferisodalaceae bacterium]|jgi:geranylgeranyl reductase family protein